MRAVAIALAVLTSSAALAQEPRLFHVPTAYLAPEWGGRASAGIGSQGDLWAEAATGILKVADLEITLGDEIRKDGAVVPMPTAQFRMGVAEKRLAPWQPAVALGFRRSLATIDGVDAAELWVAGSRRIWQFTLHVGGDLWDASAAGQVLHDRPVSSNLRPFGGLEWRPPWYPKTTLLGEWSWVPEITRGNIDMRWLGGFGVRYFAFDWLSLDLVVRFRESADPTVMTVKLNETTVGVRFNVGVGGETH